jgi:hypothetical protein
MPALTHEQLEQERQQLLQAAQEAFMRWQQILGALSFVEAKLADTQATAPAEQTAEE